MRSSGSKRVANSLVAMGSAAVLTVYAAGFLRTRAAAQKLAGAEQRRVAPAPAEAGGSASPKFIEPPAAVTRTASTQTLPPLKRDATREAATTSPSAAARKTMAAPATPATASTAQAPVSSTEPAPASVTPATPATATTVTAATAATVTPAEPTPPPAPKALYKDGTYSGWGTSRHGDIQASVVIEDGRIVNAMITQCLTRYSCSWIAHLPPQIVGRQSPECDFVSGATQSTNAFYYAIVEALSKAK